MLSRLFIAYIKMTGHLAIYKICACMSVPNGCANFTAIQYFTIIHPGKFMMCLVVVAFYSLILGFIHQRECKECDAVSAVLKR